MRCRSGHRRLLGAGRFWPSRVGLRGKRVARSLRGLGAKRLLAHLHTILYMRACVIARLGDSNHSPRRIIINPSIFANHPACRVAVRRFFAQQKTADPTGSYGAPWLLIFNCLKELKSGDLVTIGLVPRKRRICVGGWLPCGLARFLKFRTELFKFRLTNVLGCSTHLHWLMEWPRESHSSCRVASQKLKASFNKSWGSARL
jgi:hypothetical protein